MKKALFGIAKNQEQAVSIFNQLKGAGFSDHDISVLFPDEEGVRHYAHEQHTKMPEGAAVGGAGGIVIGGVLGWLVGIGMLAIPGLGPFIAAGPIIAALAGAGAGASTGVVVGSIIGVEMPEFEAIQYQGKMDGGNILISVLTADKAERRRAKEIFKNAGTVTAAEAVVDHAYNRPSGAAAVGVAMTPASQQVNGTHFTDHAGPAAWWTFAAPNGLYPDVSGFGTAARLQLGVKRQVVLDFLKKGMGLRELTRKHSLSRNLLSQWMRKYETGQLTDEVVDAVRVA